MPNIDDILSALGSGAVARARRQYQDTADDMLQQLSTRGAFATPAAMTSYLAARDDQLMRTLGEILPQLDLQAYKIGLQRDQSDRSYRQNQQMLAQQQQATQRQLDIAERQQTLAELMQQAQAEALRRQAADWLTPLGQMASTLLGQSLGTLLGAWGYTNLSKLFGGKL